MTQSGTRTVFVTGAGSGIGAATALLLAGGGAHVCCADVDRPAAETTARLAMERGGRASAHALDVREEAQWERVVEHVLETHGRPSVLVNCAGISAASPLAETSLAEWRRVLATNLDGAFLATKYGVRMMRKSGGVIVHNGIDLAVDGGFVL